MSLPIRSILLVSILLALASGPLAQANSATQSGAVKQAGETPRSLLASAKALPPSALEARVDLCRLGINLLTEDATPSLAIELHLRLGNALLSLQHFSESLVALEVAATMSRASDDDHGLMLALYNVAFACTNIGEFDRAIAAGVEVTTIAQKLGRMDIGVSAENLVGAAHERMGNREEAMRAYSRALEIVELSGDTASTYALLNNLSVLHMNAGQLERALSYLERARSIAESLGDVASVATTIANEGDVHLLAGRLEQALACHQEALRMRKESATESEIALSCSQIGDVYIELGEPETAIEHLERAHEVQVRLGQRPEIVTTLSRLSRAYAALDRPVEAIQVASAGAELAEAIQTKALRAKILRDLAAAHEAGGDHTAALAAERTAFDLHGELNSMETSREFALQSAEAESRLVTIQKNAAIAALERDAALANAELLHEREVRRLLIGGGVLVLVLALVGWSWLILKRHANEVLKRSYAMERRVLEAGRLESLALLSGGVAHDFNNLLTVILGNSELARIALREGGGAGEHLEDIEAACKRATDLARQMLLYSGKTEIDRVPVDLALLVHETVELLRGPLVGTVEFESKADANLPPVSGDRIQLGQLVLNLLTNAVQAIADGPGTVQARVTLVDDSNSTRGGAQVKLTVADSGVGMDERTIDKIFDPFFSTKQSGRGLGLATVQGIVRRHAGEIDVQSKIGEGTVFTVVLPVSDDAFISLGSTQDELSFAPVATGVDKALVLVIDDEEGVLQTTGRLLRVLGYETLLASTGASGLQMIEDDHNIAVVLLDLVMPGMSGEETLDHLRELRPGLPVLLVSGYDQRGTVTRLIEDSCVHFLGKPFGLDDLRPELAGLLGATSTP